MIFNFVYVENGTNSIKNNDIKEFHKKSYNQRREKLYQLRKDHINMC